MTREWYQNRCVIKHAKYSNYYQLNLLNIPSLHSLFCFSKFKHGASNVCLFQISYVLLFWAIPFSVFLITTITQAYNLADRESISLHL